MINFNIIQAADFTADEMKVVKLHMSTYSQINFSNVTATQRDENGYLCVKYNGDEWYHYNPSKMEWW